VYPRDAGEMRSLIRRSDEVLFHAKRAGKNTVLTTQDVPPADASSGTTTASSSDSKPASKPAVSGVGSSSSS